MKQNQSVSRDEASEMWLRFDNISAYYCPHSPDVRDIVGGASLFSYGQVAGETAAYLKILCGLKPTHKILDVGCGCGRAASLLKDYIQSPGCYHGFDAVDTLIDAAKRIFDPSRFHFRHLNIFNEEYNPDPRALDPNTLRFPYDDGFFDIVILNSVFTHILPRGMNRYVSEISRVLKTNGRCFVTFFLKQNNPKDQDGEWSSTYDWNDMHAVDGTSKDHVVTRDQKKPGDWVAYDADFVLQVFGKAGMRAVHGPLFGNWSGNPDWLTHQDIFVFEKGAAHGGG